MRTNKLFNYLLGSTLLISSFTQAQSDNPCGAPVLPVGAGCVNTAGTTVGAAYQNNAANGGTPSCANPNNPDVWYQFVAPPSGALNIVTSAGSFTDSGMGLYNGPCGSPTEITCDDDGAAGNMSQINATGLTPGVTYFIRVWKFRPFIFPGASTGTFSICLTAVAGPPPPPTNVNCSVPDPICSGSPINFTAQSNGTAASTVNPGNNYGCLSTSPNPSWYYLRIGTGGNLVIDITAGSDVDYAIWGPFPSVANAIANCDSYGTPADCSYSTSATEQVNLTGVLVGQVYVLLVTNFAAVVQTIDINDAVANTALTDCSIVPLSISLSNFSTKRENDQVNLSWITTKETNNDYFLLEKSKEGKVWSAFDYVKGAGNSSNAIRYAATDENATSGFTFYRLKQFDFDGNFTTSEPISVNDMQVNSLQLYPNPATDNLNVIASFEFETIQFIDIQGNVLETIQTESTSQTTLEVINLKEGMYFLKISNGINTITQRFAVNK